MKTSDLLPSQPPVGLTFQPTAVELLPMFFHAEMPFSKASPYRLDGKQHCDCDASGTLLQVPVAAPFAWLQASTVQVLLSWQSATPAQQPDFMSPKQMPLPVTLS